MLIGDAAHCPAFLSGQGTTLAMLGAYRLAEALRDHPRDAFSAYERAHRPIAVKGQRMAGQGKAILLPQSRAGIWLRDKVSYISDVGLWPRSLQNAAT